MIFKSIFNSRGTSNIKVLRVKVTLNSYWHLLFRSLLLINPSRIEKRPIHFEYNTPPQNISYSLSDSVEKKVQRKEKYAFAI